MAGKKFEFQIVGKDGNPKTVVIEGSWSLTRKQAEAVFKQQYPTLISANTTPGSNLANSALAGVPGLPSGTALQGVGDILNNADVTSALGTVSQAVNQLPPNLMDTGDFVTQVSNIKGVAKSLDTQQTQAIMAQASKTLGTNANTVSSSLGIGKYGFTPEKLESQGFLKPGTSKKYLQFGEPATVTSADEIAAQASGGTLTAQQAAETRRVESLLGSPTIWTGKDGANKLSDIVGNEKLQSKMQQEMLTDGLGLMQEKGFITGNESSENLGALASAAANGTPEQLEAYLQGNTNIPTELKTKLDQLSAGGSFSVDFVKSKLPPEIKKPELPPAFVDTVKRQSVEMQRAALSVNDRISSYSFGEGLGEPITVTKADKDRAKALNAQGKNITPEAVASLRNAQQVYGGIQGGGLSSLLGGAGDLLGPLQGGLGDDLLGTAESLGGVLDGETAQQLAGISQDIFAASAEGGAEFNIPNELFLSAGTGGFEGGLEGLQNKVAEQTKIVENDITPLVSSLQSRVDTGETFKAINPGNVFGSNSVTWQKTFDRAVNKRDLFLGYKKFALKTEPYNQATIDTIDTQVSQLIALIVQLEKIRLKAIDNSNRA